mmetsp:Transcript_140545/g.350354  ORF Transcript_140545/g.350354 Transcript_140545/m.350354 type:complete len:1466 (-) Transcript_140545:49-4446(-)
MMGDSVGNRFIFPAPEPSYGAQSYKRHLCWIPWNVVISPERANDERWTDGIPCLWFPAPKAATVIMFFHANAEDLGMSFAVLKHMRDQFKVNVLAVEYPGYGLLHGMVTSESAIYEVALTAFRFLVDEIGIRYSQIILFGRSLGSGPAVYLAAQYPVGGLILVSAFSSIRAAVQSIVGRLVAWTFKERFPNSRIIANVSCSTLFIHGENDGLIPAEHSLRLFKRCRARKLLITPPRMEHNSNLFGDASFLAVPAIHFFGFPGYYTSTPPRLPACLFENPESRKRVREKGRCEVSGLKPWLCDCLAKSDPHHHDVTFCRPEHSTEDITIRFFANGRQPGPPMARGDGGDGGGSSVAPLAVVASRGNALGGAGDGEGASLTAAAVSFAKALPASATAGGAPEAASDGGDEGLRQLQQATPWLARDLLSSGSETQVHAGFHICSGMSDASTESNLALSFPSNPGERLHSLPIGNKRGWYMRTVLVTGNRPYQLRLAAESNDGVCIDGITLDHHNANKGSNGEGQLPVWLDFPCTLDKYQGIPCATAVTWSFPPPSTSTFTTTSTSKTSTTTTSATTTTTSKTSTSSTTSKTSTTSSSRTTTSSSTTTTVSLTQTTSSTSSTTQTSSSTSSTTETFTTTFTMTSTTSTTTKVVVIQQLTASEKAMVAAAPPAFFDEFKAKINLDTNYQSVGDGKDRTLYAFAFNRVAKQFLGIEGNTNVEVTSALKEDADGHTEVLYTFQVKRGCKPDIEEMRDRMDFEKHPESKQQFNAWLSHLPAPHKGGSWEWNPFDIHFPNNPFAEPTQPDCIKSVSSVVYAVMHNPAVVISYKWYFLVSTGLTLCILAIIFCVFRDKAQHHMNERLRGELIIPIFLASIFFQSGTLAIKSLEKYMMLVSKCQKSNSAIDKAGLSANATAVVEPPDCPPSPVALFTEISIFSGMILVLTGVFVVCWWLPRWRADCSAEQSRLHARRTREASVVLLPEGATPVEGVVECEQKELDYSTLSPSSGDRVEVIWQGSFQRATLVEDRGPGRFHENRWVVQCDSDPQGVFTRAPAIKFTPPTNAPSVRIHREIRSILNQYNVTPLQSLMRRGYMLAFMEVQRTDVVSPLEHMYLIALEFVLSFAVVMTSFFLLQRYELPGLLTAWFPYKLIFELVVASALKGGVRFVVAYGYLGSFQLTFVRIMFFAVLAWDFLMWLVIGALFESIHGAEDQRTLENRMRLLDITVGAGIVNFLLSRFSVTFAMLLGSAYVYEPYFRYKTRRAVRLTNVRQVRQLISELGPNAPHIRGDGIGSTSGWELYGDPVMLCKDAKNGMLSVEWNDLVPGDDEPDTLSPWDSPRTERSVSVQGSMPESSCSSRDLDFKSFVLDRRVRPTIHQPVVVQVRRADESCFRSCLVFIIDLVLCVDDFLPVGRRLQTAAHSRDLVDYEECGSASDPTSGVTSSAEETEEDSADARETNPRRSLRKVRATR